MRVVAVLALALAWILAPVAAGGCTGEIVGGSQRDGGDPGAVDGPGPGGPDGGANAADAAPPADAPPPDAPPPPEPWSFVAYGDNQFATTSCTSGVSERMAVPEVILDLAPTFVIHVGDLMDHGYEDGAYAHFVSCYQEMIDTLPFFPTMGNHDAGSGAVWDYKAFLETLLDTRNAAAWGAGYADAFPTWYEDDPNTYSTNPSAPGSHADVPSGFSFKTYYAFKHRNAYFISMEVGTRWWSDTPRSWLGDHLAAATADPEVEHVFVFLHHPIYSTTMVDESESDSLGPVRAVYEPIFDTAPRLRAVFAGHAHVYDRMYVPFDKSETRASPPPATVPLGEGVQYIVTGGGGGPLPSCSPFNPVQQTSWAYSQARHCGYHVTHVTVQGPTIAIEAIGVDGSATSYTTSPIDAVRIE